MAWEKKLDLILFDLIMPIKNGFEMLKELKADEALKDIRVIILSNLSQDENRQRVMELGAADYIIKANVSFREVIETVKKHLDGR